MNLLRNLVWCSDTKRLLVYLFLYSIKLLNLSSAREEAVPLVILDDKKILITKGEVSGLELYEPQSVLQTMNEAPFPNSHCVFSTLQQHCRNAQFA